MQRATLEIIAPSVEEAVDKGLADLGLARENVEIEVLDEGSRGLFGLGSRQARVRLTVKSDAPTAEPSTEPASPPAVAPAVEPVAAAPAVEPAVIPAEPPAPAVADLDDEVLSVAQATVSELLERMKVHATVVARYGETDEDEKRPVYVDIRGDDLSILIGRRSETLNALQYIAGLIVGKELGHSIALMIDVEGYRARREAQLRQLARRMADQAIKTGRRQTLEPMPASERRIIHMELRNHPDVHTESTGDDPHRKVNILLKK